MRDRWWERDGLPISPGTFPELLKRESSTGQKRPGKWGRDSQLVNRDRPELGLFGGTTKKLAIILYADSLRVDCVFTSGINQGFGKD